MQRRLPRWNRSEQLPVAVGTKGDVLRFTAAFDGWVYVHLYGYGAGKLPELDTFAIPEAHDPAYARGFGDLSVHEVATSAARDDLAYLSYYSGGFRVLIKSGGQEYVAASDRDFGLYIFRYTGS